MTSEPRGPGTHEPQEGGKAGDEAPSSSPQSDPRGTTHKKFLTRHRRAVGTLLAGAIAIGFAYYVLPQLVGLGATIRRLRDGNLWWLGLAIPLETVSVASYVALFRAVFGGHASRVGWRASLEITLAGGGATKVFAAAGSGGIALTV